MRDFSELPASVSPLQIGDGGGAFKVKIKGAKLRIIASYAGGWDHVSVSLAHRLPKYTEMAEVKRLFFKDDETAIEYHVPANEHVNIMPFCLHLWRPQDVELPKPPHWMV